MSLLPFGSGRFAPAMAAALRRAVPDAKRVIAIGDGLGRALEKAGLPVLAVSPKPRRRRKPVAQVAGEPGRLPLADGCADAAFASAVPAPAERIAALREVCRVVRNGGVLGIGIAGRWWRASSAEALSAALLHAGVVEIEQSRVAGGLLTLGSARHFGARD